MERCPKPSRHKIRQSLTLEFREQEDQARDLAKDPKETIGFKEILSSIATNKYAKQERVTKKLGLLRSLRVEGSQ